MKKLLIMSLIILSSASLFSMVPPHLSKNRFAQYLQQIRDAKKGEALDQAIDYARRQATSNVAIGYDNKADLEKQIEEAVAAANARFSQEESQEQ